MLPPAASSNLGPDRVTPQPAPRAWRALRVLGAALLAALIAILAWPHGPDARGARTAVGPSAPVGVEPTTRAVQAPSPSARTTPTPTPTPTSTPTPITTLPTPDDLPVPWGAPPDAVTAPARAVLPAQPYTGAGDATRFTLTGSGHIPMPASTPAAHASTLVAMPRDAAASVLAFWFAGQRESAPDVRIAYAWFDRTSGQWQPARWALDRHAAGQVLGVALRRLGNPVAWVDADGRIHLFVVATGLGGWAAGRILHLVQTGPAPRSAAELNALRFEPLRLLPLSWWWNTSHLVRSAPMPLADGGMLLPIYFELGIKYPMAMRIGPRGEFLGVQRLSRRGHLLQPALLRQDETHWLALLRDHGPTRRIAVAGTDDAGRTWQDAPSLNLPNPDASVAALSLGPQAHALAYNPLPQGRHRLDLAASGHGWRWRNVTSLALGHEGDEFSYPAMVWADGPGGTPELWVSYTEQRQRIAWARLSLSPLRPPVLTRPTPGDVAFVPAAPIPPPRVISGGDAP